MGNPDVALATFEKLKALGVGLALDDFGTGYSSMSYLSMFPFDTLKIDRSIVAGEGDKREKMLNSILNLARELELDVVAEGVENTSDAENLSELGCQFGQSYLFGAPANADQTTRLLRERFAATAK